MTSPTLFLVLSMMFSFFGGDDTTVDPRGPEPDPCSFLIVREISRVE